MTNGSESNRVQIEKELLALILNKNEVIDLLQITPKLLYDKDLSKMLHEVISTYKKYKVITPSNCVELFSDFNIDLWLEIYDGTFYSKDRWKQQLETAEENIVKYYKKDTIEILTKQLNKNEITYDQFVEKIEKVNKIRLNSTNSQSMLTVKDIDMSHDEDIEFIESNTKLLDKKIKGFAIGQLSVWSGSNASAKSTYLNQLAIESIQQGYNVAIYSGELVAKRLLKWMIMQCAGKKNMSHNEKDDYYFVNSYAKEKILKWLNGRLFVYNNENGNKVRTIIESIKETIIKNNIKVLILDNLMSMDMNGYGENKYDTQSDLAKELSSIAKEMEVHIHFVCHPRKATSFLRKIDISGSADLTNIADNVFITHRVNNDFRVRSKEMFKWNDDNPIYNYSNVVEVCKNREHGVEDYFVGMFFEQESKRLLNHEGEARRYGWENIV